MTEARCVGLAVVVLLAAAGCRSGLPSRSALERELSLGARESAARDPRADLAMLRPLWYAGPGVPFGGEPSLHERFAAWIERATAEDPAAEPAEVWVRGRERHARWVLLHPAPTATAEDRALVARVARALDLARSDGVLPDPRSGLAVLLSAPDADRLAEWRADGEQPFVSVAFAAAPRAADPDRPERPVLVLERAPDPGARLALPPDEGLDWRSPAPGELGGPPDAAAVVARCALVDHGGSVGGWAVGERPWQGVATSPRALGADRAHLWLRRARDPGFLVGGPAELSQEDEAARSASALLAIGWYLADAGPGDLERYLTASLEELSVRRDAASSAAEPGIAEAWRRHQNEAVSWLRQLCLGLEVDEARAAILEHTPVWDDG